MDILNDIELFKTKQLYPALKDDTGLFICSQEYEDYNKDTAMEKVITRLTIGVSTTYSPRHESLEQIKLRDKSRVVRYLFGDFQEEIWKIKSLLSTGKLVEAYKVLTELDTKICEIT